ncbi:unnamed protein product [Closterium sp. NIES-64]|nr:unnamed protein product [Closterium sp. NIES-64]
MPPRKKSSQKGKQRADEEKPWVDPPCVVWIKAQEAKGAARPRIANEAADAPGPSAPYIAHDEDGAAENIDTDSDVDSDELEEIVSSSEIEADSDNSDADESEDGDDEDGDATTRAAAGRKRPRRKSRAKMDNNYNTEWAPEELARKDMGSGNKATKKPRWWEYVQNLKHGTAAVRPHVVDSGGAGVTDVDPNAYIPSPNDDSAGPSGTPAPMAAASGAGTPGKTPRRRVDETATMGGARLISDTIVACTKEGLQQLNQMAQFVVAAMTLAAHGVPPPASAARPKNATADGNGRPLHPPTQRPLFSAPETRNDANPGPSTQPL